MIEMTEIKITNGDEIRNYDDAHLAMWAFEMAKLISKSNVTETMLCEWLGKESKEEFGKDGGKDG